MATQLFDFIIIGAGSAGCVLAHRLVRNGHTVLLLEAGPPDDTAFVRIPATFIRVLGTSRTWVYETEPQSSMAGRRLFVPQGRTLGGGSSVNAMVYVRGSPRDYDDWHAAGCTGWSWQDVLPAFRRAECNERLSGPLHGVDGPLPVSDPRHRHPLCLAFLRGAQELGLPYNDDFNGPRQDGVGFYQTTTVAGRRASTASTYLADVRTDPRLQVRTSAHVLRIDLDAGRAVGVTLRGEDGSLSQALAGREVILAAGALGSPKILLLSGIGPGAELQALGIPVRHDLPGVGRNFQDHLEVPVLGRSREAISLAGQDRGLAALRHGMQWTLFRSGLLASNVVECGGFVDSLGLGRPDLQLHVLPTLVGDVDREPLPGHGISINPCFLRPKSRGVVRLRSADPMAPIRFEAGYLEHPDDLATLTRGLRLARRILRTPSMRQVIAEELAPAREDDPAEAALERHVRERAKTVYHPSGTCRMGVDADAVVDPRLRVHGIDGLRVCDASIMPTLVSGNTNAPTIMIAERCAEFVLDEA